MENAEQDDELQVVNDIDDIKQDLFQQSEGTKAMW